MKTEQELQRRTDTEIAHSALAHLKWDIEVPDVGVTVTVDHSILTLAGTVKWNHQRVAAERAVQNLTGVSAVINRIAVVNPVSAQAVRDKIVSALKRRAELDAARIRVETSDGKVTLQGTVRSWAEKRDAEQAAWSAPGVFSVEDQMSILV